MSDGSPGQAWTKCTCNVCSGHIEFAASEAGSTVTCPHCGMETTLFAPRESVTVLKKPKRGRMRSIAGAVAMGVVPIAVILFWQYHLTSGKSEKYLQAPIEVLREKATSGDAEAQAVLGWRLYTGDGVPANEKEGFSWVSKAAERDNAEAQYYMGCICSSRKGPEADSGKAFQWFLKSAKQGYTGAYFTVAGCYAEGIGVVQNKAEAHKWYTKAFKSVTHTADPRNKEARTALANYFPIAETDDAGEIHAPEETVDGLKLVFAWWLKLAQRGDADGELRVGRAYEIGWCVQKDQSKAATWYRKAFDAFTKSAESGDVLAEKRLGDMYRYGLGVGKYGAEALNWYTKAAKQGDEEAEMSVAEIYQRDDLLKNAKEAVTWYMKAAEQGNSTALFRLRESLENAQDPANTKGLVIDDPATNELLFQWFIKRAERGEPADQMTVAEAYEQGIGVAKDEVEAFKWNLRAAKQGNSSAQFRVGLHFEFGDDTQDSRIEAYKWYSLAAVHGNSVSAKSADDVAKRMTDQELSEARRRTDAFVPQKEPGNKSQPERE